MKRRVRPMTAVALFAVGQLLFAQSAHAQTPPPAAAPVGAPPPAYPQAPAYPPGPPGAYDASAPQLRQPMMAPPPPVGPIVFLRVDNPRGRLQQLQLKWRDVCVAPCGAPMDPSGVFRIGGGTIRPSEEFRMPRPSGQVAIDAQTGSTVKHWAGVGLLIGGGVLAAFGGLLLAFASDVNNSNNLNGGTTIQNGVRAEGLVYLVTGVILAGIGVPLSMSSTSVEVR